MCLYQIQEPPEDETMILNGVILSNVNYNIKFVNRL